MRRSIHKTRASFASSIFACSGPDGFRMLLLEEKNPPHGIFRSDRGLWDRTVFFIYFSPPVAILSGGRLSGATAMGLLLGSQNNCLTRILGICPCPMVAVGSRRRPLMVWILGCHTGWNGLYRARCVGWGWGLAENRRAWACLAKYHAARAGRTAADMDGMPAKCWPVRGGFIPESDRCLPSWRPRSNELSVLTSSWTSSSAPEKVA